MSDTASGGMTDAASTAHLARSVSGRGGVRHPGPAFAWIEGRFR
ncbi:hypothetical protein HMPREF0321_2872 [Dermacoccus sp. Ellin185]|nr:hypothetical protein HMPREF0321_2872 [Dermacoccus sp. Ellin185]